MWDSAECCKGCNSKDGVVIDHEARKTSCSECGLDFGTGDSGLSNVTTEPSNVSSDDFLSLTLGNSLHGGSAPVSVATTETKKKSSDLEYLEKRALDAMMINLVSDPASIAAMSFRLCLRAKVKDKANEIFKKVEKKCTEKDRIAFNAACIYIACRQEYMTLSPKEIFSAVAGATMYDISKAIRVIAETLKINKNWLMEVKAADFINRFCANLGMDGKAVKAAQDAAQAAKSYKRFESCGYPLVVAAVIVYVITRLSDKKKLLKDVSEATGVERSNINKTYRNLYRYLSRIIPKWFADVKVLETPDFLFPFFFK